MKKDISYSFSKNIEVVDKFRFYRWTYSFRPSAGIVEQLRLAKMVDKELGKYDRSLWGKVQRESEEIGKPIISAMSNSYNDLYFYIFIVYALFGGLFVAFSRVYFFPETMSVIFIFLVGLFILFMLMIFKVVLPRSKMSIQKSFVQKKLAQELINSAIEFFKSENVDPEKYPLKLKFNDYTRLMYVKKKKYMKEYSAYLNLEENTPVQTPSEEEINDISSKPTSIFIIGTLIIVAVLMLLIII